MFLLKNLQFNITYLKAHFSGYFYESTIIDKDINIFDYFYINEIIDITQRIY